MKKKDSTKQKKEKNSIRIWIENIIEVLIIIACIAFSIITISNPGGVKEDYSKINVNYMPVLSESMSGTFEKGDLIFGNKIKKDDQGNNQILDIGEVAIFVVDDSSQSEYIFINTHRIVGYYYQYTYENKNLSGYNDMFKAEGVTNEITASEFATKRGWTNFKILGYITSGDNKSIYYKNGDTNGELIDSSNTNLIDRYIPRVSDVVGVWNGKKISHLGDVITWVKQPTNFFFVIILPLMLLFAYNVWTVIKYVIEIKTQKARKQALEEAKANGISLEEEEEIKRKAIEEYIKKMNDQNNQDK